VPYIKEAGTIFAFYATGIAVFYYLAWYQLTETEYFAGEEGVVIPKYVVEEHPEMASKTALEYTEDGPQVKASVELREQSV
jgi:hypothetical protein